jgi:hypothetical protein
LVRCKKEPADDQRKNHWNATRREELP